jgi:hypothetical protein
MKSQNLKPSARAFYKKSPPTNTELLPGFEALIREWLKVHQQYFDAFQSEDRETSFQYRERPQVSLLGAAAFFCNGISLQEWPLDKMSKREGRNDLWLRLKHQGKTHDYFVEAKHAWIGLEKKPIERLKNLVDSATASAEKIESNSNGEKRIRLALSFASLTYPSGQLRKSDKVLNRFISRLENFNRKNRIHGWAAIWVNASDFFGQPKSKHTSIGLVMLVKRLDDH